MQLVKKERTDSTPATDRQIGQWDEEILRFKRHLVHQALSGANGSVPMAAQALGLSRVGLYKIIRSLDRGR